MQAAFCTLLQGADAGCLNFTGPSI
jgi:hypothetical protein